MVSLLRFASPSMKREIFGRIFDMTPETLTGFDDLLTRAGASLPIEATVGRKVNLDFVIALLTDKSARAPLMAVVPQVGNAIGSPEARRGLAQLAMRFIEQDPDGLAALQVLEKISQLDIPGFGDVEHESPLHFVETGLLPFVAQITAVDTTRITCAYCHTESEISPSELAAGEFVCPICVGISDCSHAR